MMGYCSWKCFATGLLIGTLCFITISIIGGLVAIPVIYVRCTTDDHHQVSAYVLHPHLLCDNVVFLICNEHQFPHLVALFYYYIVRNWPLLIVHVW